jgi:hypothetical protein
MSKDYNVFDANTEIKIGNKIYIIERHFAEQRELADAIYAVVKNEAVRKTA